MAYSVTDAKSDNRKITAVGLWYDQVNEGVEPVTQEEMLRAFYAADAAYDGQFYVCVRSTGIFCFPSCPARRPRPENVQLVTSREEALALGFRPCKRCRTDLPGGRAAHARVLVEQVTALAAGNLGQATVPWLAGQVGLSPAHLTRLFRRVTGSPLEQHVRRLRVEEAAVLLQNGSQSILDIAAAVGFASTSSLYAAFSQHYGLPPAAYRQKAAVEEASDFA